MKPKFTKNKLASSLASIKDPAHMAQVLADLLTPAEIDDVLQRISIVDMLEKGETQRAISNKLKVSIAKVTRGASVWRGSKGGFAIILKYLRLPKA